MGAEIFENSTKDRLQTTARNLPHRTDVKPVCFSHGFRSLAASLAMALTLVIAIAAPARAQLNSNESTATLTAVLPESLTVTLVPNAVAFTLATGSGTNAGSLTIAATTTWTLAATRTSLALYGYFSSAASALVHTSPSNSIDIPSARVEISVNGGANAAFDQTVAFGAASAGRQLFSQAIGLVTSNGSRTDTLALNINLSGYVLPADTYTGTLRIRAQATP